MAERNLEVIKMNEVEKKVKIGLWRQRIGYGSSDFACNLIWQMISLYLLYFYTNVMHLNAGAVSVMFLVTKVIDGISDLIVGFLIDKTNTRWGKSRPWCGSVWCGSSCCFFCPEYRTNRNVDLRICILHPAFYSIYGCKYPDGIYPSGTE